VMRILFGADGGRTKTEQLREEALCGKISLLPRVHGAGFSLSLPTTDSNQIIEFHSLSRDVLNQCMTD
jgi:hypothetical protein